MQPVLVLINGLPGTGKSTLAQKLRHDLVLPMLSKDMIKEWLFDNQDMPAAQVTSLLGKTSSRMLYVFAEDFLTQGKAVIIESAFHAAFAKEEISALLERTGASCIELYCTTELEENRRRFMGRIHDGSRHPVHIDSERGFVVDDEIIEKYRPLQVGQLITTDTTHFGDSEYQETLQTIREGIANVQTS